MIRIHVRYYPDEGDTFEEAQEVANKIEGAEGMTGCVVYIIPVDGKEE